MRECTDEWGQYDGALPQWPTLINLFSKTLQIQPNIGMVYTTKHTAILPPALATDPHYDLVCLYPISLKYDLSQPFESPEWW